MNGQKQNPPDLFNRSDGWYRSEYWWPRLCFAIRDRANVGRQWEDKLEEGDFKPWGCSANKPEHFLFVGTLTFICNLDGSKSSNEWDGSLELE